MGAIRCADTAKDVSLLPSRACGLDHSLITLSLNNLLPAVPALLGISLADYPVCTLNVENLFFILTTQIAKCDCILSLRSPRFLGDWSRNVRVSTCE